MGQRHWFVAPALDGPITGGTLYNRCLAESLRELGDRVDVVDSVEACEGFAWVDSLFLPQMAGRWSTRPTGLLVHYLPSVFEHRASLEPFERDALANAALLVCTGTWMQDTVGALGTAPTALVEPGVAAVRPVPAPAGGAVRAVLVGTVTARKGILEFLRALRQATPLATGAHWSLEVLGDAGADPDYARACRSAGEGLPVKFLGALEPQRALERIAGSHLLISASSIESYGMAIAEAQACGVPVLARRGGHVDRLVGRVPTGTLVGSARELAAAFFDLARSPGALAHLRRQSQVDRPRRSWMDAARDFRSLRTG